MRLSQEVDGVFSISLSRSYTLICFVCLFFSFMQLCNCKARVEPWKHFFTFQNGQTGVYSGKGWLPKNISKYIYKRVSYY